jgi:ADP-ribose pyrophosphatase YjhB (NUDIX family)
MSQPQIVCAAVIEKKGKLLLVKRGREPFKEYWAFISGIGGFEKASDPDEVVKLEVKGDVNCTFEGEFLCYNYEENEKPQLVMYYAGTIQGDPLKAELNKAITLEVKWFTIEEAKDMRLAYDNKKILEYYLSKRKEL